MFAGIMPLEKNFFRICAFPKKQSDLQLPTLVPTNPTAQDVTPQELTRKLTAFQVGKMGTNHALLLGGGG